MLGRPPLYAPHLPQLGEKKNSLSSIFTPESSRSRHLENFRFLHLDYQRSIALRLRVPGFQDWLQLWEIFQVQVIFRKSGKDWKVATIKMHGAGLDAEASSDLKEGTEWACSKVDHLSTTISNTFATYIISIKQRHHHRHCVHQIVIEQGAVAWNNNQRLCYCGEEPLFSFFFLIRDPGHICALPCL